MTVKDSRLFLFGGDSGSQLLTDLHIFNTTTLTWFQPDVNGILPPGVEKRGERAVYMQYAAIASSTTTTTATATTTTTTTR